jgi:hypothetical protein
VMKYVLVMTKPFRQVCVMSRYSYVAHETMSDD